MPEEFKERVTDEEIAKNLFTLSCDKIGEYIHEVGSQRMFKYLQSLLFNKKLPNYTPLL